MVLLKFHLKNPEKILNSTQICVSNFTKAWLRLKEKGLLTNVLFIQRDEQSQCSNNSSMLELLGHFEQIRKRHAHQISLQTFMVMDSKPNFKNR